MSVYYSKIAAIYPDFPKEYKNWMTNNNNFLFSPVELNDRYSDYRKVVPLLETVKLKAVNYNDLVEEILRMNPHPIVNPPVTTTVKGRVRKSASICFQISCSPWKHSPNSPLSSTHWRRR